MKKQIAANTIVKNIFTNLRTASKSSHVNVNRFSQHSDIDKARSIIAALTNAKQTHIIDTALRCKCNVTETAQLLVEFKRCASEADALKRIKRHMSDTSSRVASRNVVINDAAHSLTATKEVTE